MPLRGVHIKQQPGRHKHGGLGPLAHTCAGPAAAGPTGMPRAMPPCGSGLGLMPSRDVSNLRSAVLVCC